MPTQSQKQALIGELIAGVLVKEGANIVGKAVRKGLERVADRPDVAVTEVEAKKAAPVVAQEVTKEVYQEAKAQAEHKFDAEPHWQSRNIWGSFVGLVTAANTIYLFWTDDVVQGWDEWSIPIGILVAAITPLWSRFISKKPLFR